MGQHPTSIPRYEGSLENLAEAISKLRFDRLHDLLENLRGFLASDARVEKERRHSELAKILTDLSDSLDQASVKAEEAFCLSARYMEEEIEVDP